MNRLRQLLDVMSNRLRPVLDVVGRHRVIAIATAVVLVVGIVTTVVLLSWGKGSPKSRTGDPALDAMVALPEQLYSPPNPLETSRDAAKRVQPLITPNLFAAMSAPRERETNYKMGVVAQQHGTLTAEALIDDHAVRHFNDTPTAVSRTVIVTQRITYPDRRFQEDRFSIIEDAVMVNGFWKVNSIGPAPTLDIMNGPATLPPPPAVTTSGLAPPPPVTGGGSPPPTTPVTSGESTPTTTPTTTTSNPPPVPGQSTVTSTVPTTVTATETSTVPGTPVTTVVTSTQTGASQVVQYQCPDLTDFRSPGGACPAFTPPPALKPTSSSTP